MPYENPFLARLAAGEPSIGSWVSTPEPIIAELIASVGFDHVIVDMQHGTVELATLAPVLQAIAAAGSAGIVRVPWNDGPVIGKALDLGALAIVVPVVETAGEAARVVAACAYPPMGRRSVGPLRPNLFMASNEPSDWERVGAIVMVETTTGLANVDAIAATPGLTGIYIGPGDLAISMAIPVDPGARSEADAARHAAGLETIRQACERHGIASGLYAGDGESARRYLDAGFQIVSASIDYGVLESASRRDLEIARGFQPPAPAAG
jgi:4-hydroxy-2-oxoheptanedioate aldolase